MQPTTKDIHGQSLKARSRMSWERFSSLGMCLVRLRTVSSSEEAEGRPQPWEAPSQMGGQGLASRDSSTSSAGEMEREVTPTWEGWKAYKSKARRNTKTFPTETKPKREQREHQLWGKESHICKGLSSYSGKASWQRSLQVIAGRKGTGLRKGIFRGEELLQRCSGSGLGDCSSP